MGRGFVIETIEKCPDFLFVVARGRGSFISFFSTDYFWSFSILTCTTFLFHFLYVTIEPLRVFIIITAMKRFPSGESPSKWKRIIGPVDDSDSSSSSSLEERKHLDNFSFNINAMHSCY